MKPTIYDIAREAGVSKSTVSRVLNKQTNISKSAKQSVLEAIDKLNYRPNKVARALSNIGFDAIMVVFTRSRKTTIGNPFFSEIIQTISMQAEEENYDMILQTARNSEEELDKCSTKIHEKLVKGIIMLSSPIDEYFFQQLDGFNIPIVVIGNVESSYRNVYSVDTDNFQDSYQLTQYLIDKGHRDIACIHSSLDYHVSIDRLAGYYACLKDNHIPTQDKWIIDGGYTQESAFQAAKQLLHGNQLPTAIFATDDLKVLSIYRVAAENNIVIPEDISVISYCNDTLASFLSTALTAIDIPTRQLGEFGTSLLFDILKGNQDVVKSKLIPTQITERSSVRNRYSLSKRKTDINNL